MKWNANIVYCSYLLTFIILKFIKQRHFFHLFAFFYMLAIVEIFIAEVLLVVTLKSIIFVYWWFLCRICRYSASKKDKLISFKLQISITLYMLNAKVDFSFNPYCTIKIFSVLYLTLSLLFILLVDFTYYKFSRIFCIYFYYLERYN